MHKDYVYVRLQSIYLYLSPKACWAVLSNKTLTSVFMFSEKVKTDHIFLQELQYHLSHFSWDLLVSGETYCSWESLKSLVWHIMKKKLVMCKDCYSAVRSHIDCTVQHKICINHLLNAYWTKLILKITPNSSVTVPTFARFSITANSNKHFILCRKRMLQLLGCTSESIVYKRES